MIRIKSDTLLRMLALMNADCRAGPGQSRVGHSSLVIMLSSVILLLESEIAHERCLGFKIVDTRKHFFRLPGIIEPYDLHIHRFLLLLVHFRAT